MRRTVCDVRCAMCGVCVRISDAYASLYTRVHFKLRIRGACVRAFKYSQCERTQLSKHKHKHTVKTADTDVDNSGCIDYTTLRY